MGQFLQFGEQAHAQTQQHTDMHNDASVKVHLG
jgi:hypothetical protein